MLNSGKLDLASTEVATARASIWLQIWSIYAILATILIAIRESPEPEPHFFEEPEPNQMQTFGVIKWSVFELNLPGQEPDFELEHEVLGSFPFK